MDKINYVKISACILAAMMIVPAGLLFTTTNESVIIEPNAVVVEEQVDTTTLQPNVTVGKDAWFGNQGGFENTNYGSDTEMLVGNFNAAEYRSILQFDVPDNSASLSSATLSLYNTMATGAPINVSVHGVANEWDEGIYDGGIGAASWLGRIEENLLFEDFEGTVPPAGWSVVDLSGTGNVWDSNTNLGHVNRCLFGSGNSAATGQDATGGSDFWDTELMSPSIDLTNRASARLEYASNFQDFAGNGDIWLNISTDAGGSWTTLRTQTTDDPGGGTYEVEDLTPYVGNNIILKWTYKASDTTSWYWHIDDVNVTATIPWDTPGGDYNTTEGSYIEVADIDAWYSWDVTSIVDNWMDGTWDNNGFIMVPGGTPAGLNYVNFLSSDNPANADLTPKLTLTYSTEIDPEIPDQVMNEDAPARVIDLVGLANGSVKHVSGPDGGGSSYPFSGGSYDQIHYQMLYYPENIGGEGVIKRISFNRTNSAQTGNYSNFKISMAHTDQTSLTNTFANNFVGYQVEVFNEANVFLNSSNDDSWIHFDLNDNFTYDSSHNLLIDLTWSGDDGNSISASTSTLSGGDRRLWDTTGIAATGSLNSNLPEMMFITDVANYAIVDDGTTLHAWTFGPWSAGAERIQMLYNASIINEAGYVNMIAFQGREVNPFWAEMENFSIRLGHSTNDTLGTVFDAHLSGAWTTVLNEPVYYINTSEDLEWFFIDVENSFDYNGIDNLLVDIRWRGGNTSDGSSLGINCYGTASYNGYLRATDDTATTGTAWDRYNNLQVLFCESDNLTWSAVSLNTGLFTAGISADGQGLVITPIANENGVGVAQLTLTNDNGGTVTQDIPVTINAVNDAPVIVGPTTFSCTEDIEAVLNVNTEISDIDDLQEDLIIFVNSAYASVNGTEVTFLYPEGITQDNVTITVEDPGGLTGEVLVSVDITPVNDAPELTNYVDNITCDAEMEFVYTVHPIDEESVTGQLVIYTTSAYATTTNHSARFLYPKGIGSETVTIYLVDENIYGSQNNVSYSLEVTINDHPDITSHTPAGIDVPVTSGVTVTFDMAMDTNTTQNAFEMSIGGTTVAGNFSWNSGNTTLTFTPQGILSEGTYDVIVRASAESADGFDMHSAYSWSFNASLGDYDGDGDGMTDEYEIENGLDPDIDDSQSDLDGDGMPNIYEYENDLDPAVNDANADADGDGMPNIYEYENDLDPNADDADGDADGDGLSNLEEYEGGTNANDPTDAPDDPTNWLPIIFILVIVIVVVVVLFMLKNKKDKPEPEPEHGVQEWEGPAEDAPPYEGEQTQDYEQAPPPPPAGEAVEPMNDQTPPPPPPPPPSGEVDPSELITE